MGNCCAGRQEPPQVQRNNVTRDLERRLSIWQATGIVVLRDAKLKASTARSRLFNLSRTPAVGLAAVHLQTSNYLY